jgi:CubicO group peptidase (beta-lactamase class C family)
MLVDEGKVDVNDPVEKYLPEFKGQMVAMERDREHALLRRPAHPILVREALSHTSGLPFSSLLEQPTLDLLPLRDRVRSYAMMPLDFEPGSKFQYSNAGINTIGRIIEVTSGLPYEQFLHHRLFEPLGMKDTTFWPTKSQLQRLVSTYQPNPTKDGLEETAITQLRYPLGDTTRGAMPAGGLFSTAADMARFGRMILNGGKLDGRRFLSETAVRLMTTQQIGTGVKTGYDYGYGFCWAISEHRFWHGGHGGTSLQIYPDRGLALVWMVQHSGLPDSGAEALKVFEQAAYEKFRVNH